MIGSVVHPRNPVLLLVLAWACACAAPDSQSHWGRHFDGQTWTGALSAQTESADQLVPALALLGATAWAVVDDRNLQRESREGALTEGSTTKGDGVAIGLGVLGSGLALGELIGGDGGHALEVLLESAVLVDGVTEILKHTVRRDRPGDSSPDSFPSGHTSFAFTMATCLARGVDDLGDGWYDKLGYLAYIPAAYVGIDRSEANKHWPSDVAFGAFLGLFLTNVVYDAHHGTPRHGGIYSQPDRSRWSLEPSVDEHGTRLELVLRF